MDAAEASNKIRYKLQRIGHIHERRLYYDSRKTSEVNTDREGFATSGFTLIDCPTRNRKETLDKQILVDMLMFVAMAKAKSQIPCIVLISGDGDYAYCLQRARDIQCYTVVIYGDTTAPCLLKAGDVCWHMRREVLNMGPVVEPSFVHRTGSMPAATIYNPVLARGRLEPPTKVAPAPSTLSNSISDPVSKGNDDAHLSLCVAYRDLALTKQSKYGQNLWHTVWVNGAELSQKYYDLIGGKNKEHYNAMMEKAIKDGFLELGKRKLCSQQSRFASPVIYATGTEPLGTCLAPEVYVRATGKQCGASAFDQQSKLTNKIKMVEPPGFSASSTKVNWRTKARLEQQKPVHQTPMFSAALKANGEERKNSGENGTYSIRPNQYKTEFWNKSSETGSSAFDPLRVPDVEKPSAYGTVTRVCLTFSAKGRCPYGEKCWFIHEKLTNKIKMVEPPGFSASSTKVNWRTKARLEQQKPVHQTPMFSAALKANGEERKNSGENGTYSIRPNQYKTEFWNKSSETGSSAFDPLRVPDVEKPSAYGTVTRVCLTFSAKGRCPYGENCWFIHENKGTINQYYSLF